MYNMKEIIETLKSTVHEFVNQAPITPTEAHPKTNHYCIYPTIHLKGPLSYPTIPLWYPTIPLWYPTIPMSYPTTPLQGHMSYLILICKANCHTIPKFIFKARFHFIFQDTSARPTIISSKSSTFWKTKSLHIPQVLPITNDIYWKFVQFLGALR